MGFRSQSWLSALLPSPRGARREVPRHRHQPAHRRPFADGGPLFARVSDSYRDRLSGETSVDGALRGGTWTGYVFDSAGPDREAADRRLQPDIDAPSDRYTRIKGRGLYYRITAGSLKGYWVAERAGVVHATGQYGSARYYPKSQCGVPRSGGRSDIGSIANRGPAHVKVRLARVEEQRAIRPDRDVRRPALRMDHRRRPERLLGPDRGRDAALGHVARQTTRLLGHTPPRSRRGTYP